MQQKTGQVGKKRLCENIIIKKRREEDRLKEEEAKKKELEEDTAEYVRQELKALREAAEDERGAGNVDPKEFDTSNTELVEKIQVKFVEKRAKKEENAKKEETVPDVNVEHVRILVTNLPNSLSNSTHNLLNNHHVLYFYQIDSCMTHYWLTIDDYFLRLLIWFPP